MDGRMDGWMDGLISAWMDGWMSGWLDSLVGGWMDSCIDVKRFFTFPIIFITRFLTFLFFERILFSVAKILILLNFLNSHLNDF